MALSYLTDINLNKNELQNTVIQKLATDPNSGQTAGWIIYNTTENQLKVYNGSAWVNVGGDITEVVAGSGLTGGGDEGSVTLNIGNGDGITVSADKIEVDVDDASINLSASDGSGQIQIKNLGVTTGKIANLAVTTAKIAADAVNGTKIADDAINSEHIVDGSVDNVHLANDGITIGTTDVSLGDTITALVGLTDLDLTEAAHTIFDTVGANNLTVGASSTTVIIPGDLQVTGTVTTNNVETVSTSNGVIFEGNAADDHEVTLLAGTVTADRTATLPDKTGTLAMLDDVTSRSVVATIDVSDTNFISNKYAEITHNLSTEDVIVELFDSSTKETVYADIKRTDKANTASTSKVKIIFSIVPTNDIEVIITSAASANSGTVAYS